MQKLTFTLCTLFYVATLEAATITYNTALESLNGNVSYLGTDTAGNLHVVGVVNNANAVVSISPSGAINWIWSPPTLTGITNSVPAFGSDGSTYIAGYGSPGISNSSILFTNTSEQPYYVAKINPAGNPVWVAYLGSYFPEAVTIDLAGNVYATGISSPGESPFTIKLNSAGDSVIYFNNSIGGSLIAVDAQGQAVVVGPASINTQTIAGLDSQGNARFSTSLGSSNSAIIYAMQLDSSDNIYLAGSVLGSSFPVTPNALQSAFPSLPVDPGALAPQSGLCTPDFMTGVQTCTFSGSPSPVGLPISGFVSILNPDASSFIYSTFFGGSGATVLSALTLDELHGRILLAGYTNSRDTPGLISDSACVPSVFAAELTLDGSSILPTITLGFSVPANAVPAHFDPAMVELASGAVAISYGDPDIALVDRSTSSPVACVTNSPNLHPTRTVAPGQLLTVFGSGLSSDAWAAAPVNGQYPSVSPDQVSATVNGIPAPLLYTSPDQINLQIPFEVAGATTATLVIHTSGLGEVSEDLRVVTSNPTVFESPIEPGECLTSWDGETHTLAVNADGTRNACDNPAQPNSVVRFFINGLGLVDGPQITGAIIASGATTTVSASLLAPYPGGWTAVRTAPLIGSITGMYEVDVNVGTLGYDAVSYLGINNAETSSLVDIRVAPDATDLPE